MQKNSNSLVIKHKQLQDCFFLCHIAYIKTAWKNPCLEQLHGEFSAIWFKDFSQKILPMKFCKGQKEYFGKKGITLHVDCLMFR